jgi:lysine 2,3-aminomutase
MLDRNNSLLRPRHRGIAEVNPTGGPAGPWTHVSESDWDNWRWQQAHRLRRPMDFASTCGLSEAELGAFTACADRFDVAVTPYYASLMRSLDEHAERPCPIRAQALPHIDELLTFPFEFEDPLAEEANSPVSGITWRYPDRVLFYVTHNCPVYCRHCTRKRKVADPSSTQRRDEIEEALDWLQRTPQVRDVLLSGGDPLTLSDERLAYILGRLSSIDHIDVIRLGTRNPVTLPQRITDDLCHVLRDVRPLYIHTHFNHPAECTDRASECLHRLADSGAVLGNQMVLLAGVNDEPTTVLELNRWLLRQRTRPYYIFQADMTQGITHFRTPLQRGIDIVDYLRGRISGMGVPHFSVDLPGGGGKITLTPDYLVERRGSRVLFRNATGAQYEFHDVGENL